MARGQKFGGRDFKKGHPGGPGRPKITPDEHAVRDASRAKLMSVLNKFLNDWSLEKLAAFCADKTNDAFEIMCGRVILKGISAGDPKQLNFFFDRLIGPIRQQIDITGSMDLHARMVKEMKEAESED